MAVASSGVKAEAFAAELRAAVPAVPAIWMNVRRFMVMAVTPSHGHGRLWARPCCGQRRATDEGKTGCGKEQSEDHGSTSRGDGE
jgi:hypothetical protein